MMLALWSPGIPEWFSPVKLLVWPPIVAYHRAPDNSQIVEYSVLTRVVN